MSLTSAFIGGAVGLGQLGYNIWQNYRSRKDYLKQQNFSNDFLTTSRDEAVQTRSKDLVAAGLHPTLAAGSTATSPPPSVGSAQQHPSQKGSVLEHALLAANIDNVKAESDRTRRLTALDERSMKIREQELGLSIEGNAREREKHPEVLNKLHQEINHIAEMSMRTNYEGLHIVEKTKLTELQNFAQGMLNKYMKTHGSHMPTRHSDMQELQMLFSNLGLDNSSAGRAAKAVFTVIMAIIGRR